MDGVPERNNYTLYRFGHKFPSLPLVLRDIVPLGTGGENLNGITSNNQIGVAGTIKNSEFDPPDISGWWIINGLAAQVLQLDDVVTFINEHDGVSEGQYSTATQISALDWGGLDGEILDDRIDWANGSVWQLIPTLSETGTINGSEPVLVQQAGLELRFTNEWGTIADSRFLTATCVVADDWGGLEGSLADDEIQWENGTVWSTVNAAGAVPVNLAGAWSRSGLNATVLQNGNDLLFVNEFGSAATGVVIDSTHVVATGWGNLGGTIDPATRRILWDNGTIWDWVPVLNRNENWKYSRRPTAVSQLGVDFVFTNEHGDQSSGRFWPSFGVTSDVWSLGGQIRFADHQIAWNNQSVWSKSLFGDHDAVFAEVNDWPWLS